MAIRKRNKEESKKRILNAGLDVFSEHGYDAATTKMIAARSGLNESLIQRYFQSKAGLLAAVNEMSLKIMLSQKPYPTQPTPEEEIFQFLKTKLEQEEKSLSFIRVFISRILIDEHLRKEMHKNMPPPKKMFLHERMETFKKNGLIAQKTDIPAIIGIIMSQSFIMGVFERMMLNKSKAECLKQFHIFARTMSAGMAASPSCQGETAERDK